MGRKITILLGVVAIAAAGALAMTARESAPAASGEAQAATTITVNAPWVLYEAAAFAEAQQAGRTIVVDVSASWCPTCRAQAPTLEAMATEPALADAVLFKVDFDVEKDFLRQHNIPRQSTILVFNGATETARSIAETDPQRLRDAILAGV